MESSNAPTRVDSGRRPRGSESPDFNWSGARLGRYVLVELIGKGAFGTVWSAYDPELDRKVAIKVLPMSRRQSGREELVAEAQLPAQLSHPNIVAIHDVGWLSAREAEVLPGLSHFGALYIVMEHLGGPTLRQWVNERERGWSEIVRVFVQVGHGLEAAHARKLIHLDFKPGNIMFGEDGRARVLDFGLSRVVHSGDPSESGTLPIAGTPPYMAPEQHAGTEADERTDQYAFAIALWEALYGEWPFVVDKLETKDSIDDGYGWLRVLVKLKAAGPPVPPRKPSVPAHVRGALARALAAKPEERFDDMRSMLAALERDPTIRRRRWFAGGIALALSLGLGISAFSRSDPCALPSDRFVGIWDEDEALALEQAFGEVAGPDSGDELVAAIMPRVRAGLDDQITRWTAVRSQICEAGRASGQPREVMREEFLCLEVHLGRIAALTESLGEADSTALARAADSVVHLPAPEDCLETRQVSAPLDEASRATLLEIENDIARAEAEQALGHYESALAAAERALSGAQLDTYAATRGHAQLARGRVLVELGRYEEGRTALLAGLRDAESAGDQRGAVALALVLARSLTNEGEAEQARVVLELVEARLAQAELDDPRLAVELDVNVSQVEHRLSHWDEALARAEASLERQLAFAPDDELRLANIHLALGNVYVSSGRDLDQGRVHYERARDIWLELYGPGHPRIATVLLNISGVHFRAREFDATRENLLAAARIFAYTLPPTHPNMGVIHQNLAALAMIRGQYGESIEYSQLALEVLRASVGADALPFAIAEANLTAALIFEGRYPEALDHARHLASIYDSQLTEDDGRRLAARELQIEALWGLGRDQEAAALVAEIRAEMATIDAEDPRQAEAKYVLAETHRRAGELDAALALSTELFEAMDADPGAQPEPLVDVGQVHIRVLAGLGRSEEARAVLDGLLERFAAEEPHVATWALELERGRLARDAGELDDARAAYRRALALLEDGKRAPVLAAEVRIALAALAREPERRRALARKALAVLDETESRPDLRAEAQALLERPPG